MKPMKNLLRAGIACFGLLALLSFLVSLSVAHSLYIQQASGGSLNYHFALYLPDNRN